MCVRKSEFPRLDNRRMGSDEKHCPVSYPMLETANQTASEVGLY